jgi:hypothetical protein
MRSLPAGEARIDLIKNTAQPNPTTAQAIDNGSPEVMRKLAARGNIDTRFLEKGRGVYDLSQWWQRLIAPENRNTKTVFS